MKKVLLAVLLISPLGVTAQEPTDLEGTWRGLCRGCAPGAMPAGFALTLVIRVSASEITVRRDGFPAEVYRLDGTRTSLLDGRTATASVEDGRVVLTTVRRRVRRDEIDETIMRHVYRVAGNTLTIERSTRAIRPNEAPSEWLPIGNAVYQRD